MIDKLTTGYNSIEFYFHYDSGTHKGKLVEVRNGKVYEELVDKIVCVVSTMTERKEVSPKFVVKGNCNSIIISEDNGQTTAYIS